MMSHTNRSKEELVALLTVRERELAERDQRLVERDQRLAERDLRLAERDRLLFENTRKIERLGAYVESLEARNRLLERMIFGATRERFTSTDVSNLQIALPFIVDTTAVALAVEKEIATITYERTKAPKNHEGRTELPSGLRVEETRLLPKEDVTGMTFIGDVVTEHLEMRPAEVFVRRFIRSKFVTAPDADGNVRIVIADLPDGPFAKCKAGPELLTTIITDKYIRHLPDNRQLKTLADLGVPLAASSVNSWQSLVSELLRPLHAALRTIVCQSAYLQVDETGLAVQDRTKTGTTHKGFLWGYHAPGRRAVYFEYQKGRGQIHCRGMLDDYRGYLQTDDYQAYHPHKQRDGVIGLACWAHARRNFERALETDRERASVAMTLIQKLYAVEREARDGNLSHENRKELRLEKSLPVLNTISAWLAHEHDNVLPKSPIGKAVIYAIRLWDELMAYLHDGQLEIDNNLMENAIRPIALGRKNWLFAGSHAAAENIAMYRSFFATCVANNINPHKWLRYVIEHVNKTAPVNYHTLLPNFIDPELVR